MFHLSCQVIKSDRSLRIFCMGDLPEYLKPYSKCQPFLHTLLSLPILKYTFGILDYSDIHLSELPHVKAAMPVKRIAAFPSHNESNFLSGLELIQTTTKILKNIIYRPSTGYYRRQDSDMFARVYYLFPRISSRNGGCLAALPIRVVGRSRMRGRKNNKKN